MTILREIESARLPLAMREANRRPPPTWITRASNVLSTLARLFF